MGREDELEGIIAWAESQGWRVIVDKKGYRRFYRPDGTFVIAYPATPSRPQRRLADLKVKLKHNGLEIPIPTKQELRRRARRQQKEAE